jgi:hypothetical protein
MDCTLALSADTKELVEVVVHYAVAVHAHQDTPELRGRSSWHSATRRRRGNGAVARPLGLHRGDFACD